MISDKRLDKFEKLVSKKPSGFLSKFEAYKQNQKWLDKSSEIAVNILEALKDQKISQKKLADKMEVSAQQINKIIKGNQNLTLETISKLEDALNITLLKTVDYKAVTTISVKSTTIKSGIQTDEIIDVPEFRYRENNILPYIQKKTSMKVIYNGLQNEYSKVG